MSAGQPETGPGSFSTFGNLWADLQRELHMTAIKMPGNTTGGHAAMQSMLRRTAAMLYCLACARLDTQDTSGTWSGSHGRKKTNYDAIRTEDLAAHFRTKFSAPADSNAFIEHAENHVLQKQSRLTNTCYDNIVISEQRVIRMIRKLRIGCSPGVDGITAEHLCNATSTPLPLHICILLSTCLRFGIVPDTFCIGLLVPILKKPHLDPSCAANYRPITVSVMLSKILELLVLEECHGHDVDPCQFGFVEHRGTTMAIALARDVSSYCQKRGSATYFCSLDAEGAFDCIPFSVLFMKADGIIPDPYWRVLHYWYLRMTVRIRWNHDIGTPIPVKRGTRQGGLSSPFLFNIFYQEMISSLNASQCGISIDGHQFNVYCYADDVLLASLTSTGLQKLIDIADDYITRHGLRFNPKKTTCMTLGRDFSAALPTWSIDGVPLAQESSMTYLGAVLCDDGGSKHTANRVNAAQRAFYGLQGAGLYYGGVHPHVATKLYSVGVRTILTYGCEALYPSPLPRRRKWNEYKANF